MRQAKLSLNDEQFVKSCLQPGEELVGQPHSLTPADGLLHVSATASLSCARQGACPVSGSGCSEAAVEESTQSKTDTTSIQTLGLGANACDRKYLLDLKS